LTFYIFVVSYKSEFEPPPGENMITDSELREQLQDFESAKANRWVFVGIYPQPNQPWMLHNGFVSCGYEVADLVFDGENRMVQEGEYALWVKMGDNPRLANCGCVHHAEEGIPCEHDIALALRR
jgi:hypothetical protein